MSLLKDVLTSHDASVIPLDARQADYSRVSVNRKTVVLRWRVGWGERLGVERWELL